jgi:DNA modification methylase
MTSEPRWRSPLTGSEVYEADALAVAEGLPAGCASLAILDGPYGMGKAEWDRVPRGGRLADLYRPHLDALGRVCGASASLYFWNTAQGWADVHPAILTAGWSFRTMLVWDKEATPASFNPAVLWPSATEFCAHYVRGNPEWVRPSDIKNNVWRLSFQAYAGEKLLMQESVKQYMWSRSALHPSQKPLLFAERMLRASSRPGDVVWVPFGGTLRELVAAERMARADPAEARRVVTCELNADGVDYIGAALAQVQGLPALAAGQVGLFG